MAQITAAAHAGSDRDRSIGWTLVAVAAAAMFAACLLVAVRYPDVPRVPERTLVVTNLFARRLSIAVLGAAVVLVFGTLVIMRSPNPAAVRILTVGVPSAAIAAAAAMPIVTMCGPGAIGRDGTCHAVLHALAWRGPTSYELWARLAIAGLGCLGGLYFWVLAKRGDGVSARVATAGTSSS